MQVSSPITERLKTFIGEKYPGVNVDLPKENVALNTGVLMLMNQPSNSTIKSDEITPHNPGITAHFVRCHFLEKGFWHTTVNATPLTESEARKFGEKELKGIEIEHTLIVLRILMIHLRVILVMGKKARGKWEDFKKHPDVENLLNYISPKVVYMSLSFRHMDRTNVLREKGVNSYDLLSAHFYYTRRKCIKYLKKDKGLKDENDFSVVDNKMLKKLVKIVNNKFKK